ncbi:DUF4190 domain-containing protein [Paramicrobacterium agarici]|uniref:Uncharacterized protein DUF4190 n=1 Tax=Paramicrobacterium agarici TaxID=630514 RepID=A0A2A9DS47_9MICO|nr:DUF4190 domain-containing protein [Microbacterium agarici]PFG29498.1 uncharacterized protein DUF4190 [Microbacterium agarici]TQO22503.1 uncharacterized protein DUF4190 [Microbacterium agarici]
MSQTPPPPAPNPYQGAPAPQEKYNVMAIVGFILAFIVNIVGAILSFVALSQIKKTGEKGRGLAIAGVIIGLASLVITIIYIIIVVAFLGSVATQMDTYSY